MTIKEKILKIMSLALDINSPVVDNREIKNPPAGVVVEWYPHVNSLEVLITYGSWSCSSSNQFRKYSIFTDHSGYYDEKLDEIISDLESIKAEIESEGKS